LKELVDRALNLAQVKGASYADIRIVKRENQSLTVRNGEVAGLVQDENQGFGVRVIVGGSWGFASSSLLTPGEVERVTAQAVQIARASALVKTKEVNLGAPVAHVATYRTAVVVDPFQVSLEDKLSLLLAADAEMRAVSGIAVAQGSLEALRETKTFANSEGSYIQQEIIETGAGLEAMAVGKGEVQKRSYPNSFGRQQGTPQHGV